MKLFYRFTTFLWAIIDRHRFSYYKHIYGKQISADDNVKFGRYSSISIAPNAREAKLVIGHSTRFRQFCTITLDACGLLEIGANTFFNNYCSINCLSNIRIGSNTLFGEGIKIYDHNHVFNKRNIIIENQGFGFGAVIIGDNCWIGSNVIILRNVTIGDNVVIGAGCMITSSIPSNTLVKLRVENNYQSISFR